MNGAVDSNRGTKPFQIGAPTAPAIFSEGYDCFVDSRYQDAFKNCGLTWIHPATNAANRGAVLDQHWKLVDSSNPARLGDYVSIWISGLGEFKGEVWMYNVPVYGLSGNTEYPIS